MSDWQRGRALLTVTSHLGPDVLMAVSLASDEAISRPYEIRLSLVSPRPDISADEMLSRGMTVSLQHDGQPMRHFHGIVRAFAWDEHIGGRGLTRYHAVLAPRLWFLSQTVDCRIFQNQTVPDILRTIMQEQGIPAPSFKLQKEHPAREYITQYNETDLAFITRLLQEEGCFYFFEHSEGDHTLVVADDNSAFQPLPDGHLRFDSTLEADDVLNVWNTPGATAHGRVRLIDYDPTAPGKRLDEMHRTVLRAGGADTRDVTLWPALSFGAGSVSDRARYRLEAEEAAVSLVSGEGHNRRFVPGRSFTLDADPHTGAEGRSFVLQSVAHSVTDQSMLAGGGGQQHNVSFTAFESSVPWREKFHQPRPRMEGVHAAIVIGPDGSDIHTDDLGRVKVRFFWDHRKDAAPGQAVWARVIYPWGGDGWGWQSTPRVGTEVAVAFMDGDPDRPVILGGLYNGQDNPIFDQPGKAKSGIRTRSIPGGSSSNYNELTFDDTAGQEVLSLQAEKDMRTLVKNDQELTVRHCRVVRIDQDETITIGQKQSVTIGSGRTTQIQSGNDALQVEQGNLNIDVPMGAVSVNAMQSITLTVGQNSVRIDQTGITINGMMIGVSAETMLQMQAPAVETSADATVMVTAGLITLN